MKSPRRWLKTGILLSAFLSGCLPALAQFRPGQYSEEAPFRTWNSFPYIGAAALGRGSAVYAWGADATASFANPSLLVTLPKITLSLGGSFQYATAFQYGPVNTGVLETEGPVGGSFLSLDHASISFRTGRFAFAAGVALTESFNRPIADAREEYAGAYLYRVRYEQNGFLRTFHLGAAIRLSDRLGLGLGLNYESGRLDNELLEDAVIWDYKFTSTKSLDLSGFYFNGGLFWDLKDGIRAAVIFRTPYRISGTTQTLDRYQAPIGGTDISIHGEAPETYDRPLVLGAGLTWRIGDRFRTALDVSFLRWSSYRATWIGEEQDRDFRDVIRISAGGEYLSDVRLFGAKVVSPFRLGIVYDPQPMTEPRSSYLAFTFGAGLELRGFRIDLGALIGAESGSGDKLTARRISLAVGYIF